MIIKIISCLLLGLLIILRHFTKIPEDESYINPIQYILYYMIVISSLITISIYEYLISSGVNKYSSDYKLYFFISMISYLALAVLFMYQGFITSKSRSIQERLRSYHEFTKMQKSHIENLIYQDNEMRKFRHDIRMHLSTIQTLCQNNDIDSLVDYCNSYTNQGSSLAMDKYCCDSAIDAILANTKRISDNNGITTNYDIVFENSGQIDSFDLCIILMNILQNAIDANEHYSGEKYINLILHDISNTILISVKNPTSNNLYPKAKTSPHNNSNRHGFGLQNVHDAVNRYDGIIKYEQTNNEFCINISMIKER